MVEELGGTGEEFKKGIMAVVQESVPKVDAMHKLKNRLGGPFSSQGTPRYNQNKEYLHSRLRLPGLDRMAEAHISQCHPFQVATTSPDRESLHMSRLPSETRQEVALDLWV